MRTVTVEQLKYYYLCPTLYQKKFVDMETPIRQKDTAGFDGHSHIVLRAQHVIDDIVGYYFHRLMDDRQVRYQTLYKRWEKKWWEGYTGRDIADMIVPVSRANLVRTNTSFIQQLPLFYKLFHKPFKPLSVEREMMFPANGTVVESKIQMAYRTQKGKVRIVRFIPYKIAPNPAKDIDLLTQGASWMFYNDEDEVEISYYCMLSPEEYSPFTVSTITKDKIESLTRIVKAFENNELEQNGDCAGCEYRCNK